jgi:1-acyl-sn-glycerol-3-phosphate acyltransferase
MNTGNGIIYPRRLLLRKLLVYFGRILIRLFTRFQISGKENFPKAGPYIVAGNHVASMESMLMVLYTPLNVELIGTGDIPIDPNLAVFANLYGYIPIFRGSIDQTGLKKALSVLNQKGVIGIFPEGGIWEDQLKQAKIGVSWLSAKSGAPVVPVGFIGMKGALANALKFKKPVIGMKIGKVINPQDFIPGDTSLKQSLLIGANFIMKKISALLPESEILQLNLTQKKSDALILFFRGNSSESLEPVQTYRIPEVSILLNQPVLMDIFIRNLKLPVKMLLVRNRPIPMKDFIKGCNTIIAYLKENPGFLNYRLGMETGLAIQNELALVIKIFSDNEVINYEVIIKDEAFT